jgi:hypothetical protein
MRMKSYAQHERYVEICKKMELLSIKDVSTKRQKNNGTIVWRLPIKNNNSGKTNIEVASFSTGYVRNQNSGYSNYQLNKRCEGKPEYFQLDNGDYRKFTTRSCVLIPNEIDRLEYLISYCLKNYYIKHANFVADGKYVSQWYHDWSVERVTSNKVRELQDRIYELESQVDVADTRATNLSLQNEVLQNKLSNAISPTKYQCGKNKIHDLENKLATINRISE